MPRTPNPPGIITPLQYFSVFHSLSVNISEDIHTISILHLLIIPEWSNDLIIDRYESAKPVYLPTIAILIILFI